MTQEEIWNWIMEGNYPPGYPDINRPDLVPLKRRALATLKKDVVFLEYNQKTDQEWDRLVPAGTRVKIVMASRLGDVGITDNLTADFGYKYRIQCVEREMEIAGVKMLFPPQEILFDIEPVV